MGTAIQTRPRRPNNPTQKTAAFHLDQSSLMAVARLVDLGVFPNKSAAVDAALRLLRSVHADALHESNNDATA